MAASRQRQPDPRTQSSRSKAKAAPKRPAWPVRLAEGAANAVTRHPRLIIGLGAFLVINSFVAANALWYQRGHHPAPLLSTRAYEAMPARTIETAAAEDDGVTTFRIEREEPADNSEKAAPRPEPLVLKIQQLLAERGLYDGPADGLSGSMTTAAILFYEETEGLKPTGKPTMALLDRLATSRPKKTIAARDVKTVVPADRYNDVTSSVKPVARPAARPATDEVAQVIEKAKEPQKLKAIRAKATPLPVPPEEVGVDESDDPVAGLIRATGETTLSDAKLRKVQAVLAKMFDQAIEADGIAGERTRTAIRKFQRHYRLPVDGEPTEALYKKMKAIGAF